MPLTSEAKKLLAETIRGTPQDSGKGIRARLLRAIHDEAERRYRLSVSIADAGLDEAHRRRRQRIEAWLDERARATKPKNKTELAAARERLLLQAEKEAAATLVNRLVLLRLLEAQGLSKPAVLTGGWESKGYRELREFAPSLTGDETEGYATLLQLVFDELAGDLPGLFGDVGLTKLFAIPPATLRDVVERLDDPKLASAWTDDTTLGWVYQYWNDPDREALDAKINGGGKIEPHEIASKTQMFTERYMVEWLLQNSLGLTWLAMCKKHGWTPDAERVLPVLEERRAEWRKKREAGEVALDALMPIEGELEEHWKYYVQQPIPSDTVENAPESVRAIKLLDPACGSGHFLVVAFDLLTTLYREEACHLGKTVTDEEIAESILESNLHGIDIDLRAIQIAAAGLYLKAKALARMARPKRLNLVAPVLQLGNLPPDDPAVVTLRDDLKKEVGIPEELTNTLLSALADVDYLGSLLKVTAALEDAIRSVELEFGCTHGQAEMFAAQPAKRPVGEAKASILGKLESFLAKHSKSEDIGLRLDGVQLTAGVRFVRMAKEGAYDLVVGNPPYQGLGKTRLFEYVSTAYPQGKADLYAAFLERGLEFVRPGGVSSMVTIRGWMFLGQFSGLRRKLLRTNAVRFGDLGWGAFEQMTDNPVTMSVAVKLGKPERSVALAPAHPTARVRTDEHRRALEAGLLAHVGRHEFDPSAFKVIEGEPVVYWWGDEFLARYALAPKLGAHYQVRKGVCTCNDVRYIRRPWEVRRPDILALRAENDVTWHNESFTWLPTVMGAEGMDWIEPLRNVVLWRHLGLEMKVGIEFSYGVVTKRIQSEPFYMVPGVAFAMVGSKFSGRAHRYRSVFSNNGSSVFPEDREQVASLLNSSTAKFILASLNPGIGFEVGDVNRLPLFGVAEAGAIFSVLNEAFAEHERGNELSIEFRRPGGSEWLDAQSWAHRAVDRAPNEPLPPYEPVVRPRSPHSHVSVAVGVAVGRFGADGEGIIHEASTAALQSGILFVSAEGGDSVDQPESASLRQVWEEHGAAVGGGDDLRSYLRRGFFDFHKKLYENRPIYFALSSAKKSFVAIVSIHRWADDTISVLLADHLIPAKRRLDGELDDLRTARASGANKGKAEKRFAEVQKLLEELSDLIGNLTEIAEMGPPPCDDKTTKREVDARFAMQLDDGVMVNSAALWPLLEPQWKDPKKWWKELANAQGKKDYDWSHLAARYFPSRVRKKCHDDPSLAVAHKCFWELHPAKAYGWELRLQDEIRPDFTIDEPGSDEARARFLKEHEREAADILAKELKRREKKAAKAGEEGEAGPLFEQADDAEAEEADE